MSFATDVERILNVSGFNLPPGCRVSDIPGNRPEDLIREAQADEIYAIVPNCTDEQMDKFFAIIDKCYADGYQQGRADESENQAYLKHEQDTTS